jgi:hypothetical protein
MTWTIVAAVLWTVLALSLVLTIVSLWTRAWWQMALASFCAAVFGVAALASIGLFVLPIALGQAIAAIVMARSEGRARQRNDVAR